MALLDRQRWVHDPDAVQDYTVDWTKQLADDDYIVGVSFQSADVGLTILSTNFTKTLATMWLGGGVLPGRVYDFTCHVTTHAGRQDERTFQIVGKQR